MLIIILAQTFIKGQLNGPRYLPQAHALTCLCHLAQMELFDTGERWASSHLPRPQGATLSISG